jgi:hypothetical protein
MKKIYRGIVEGKVIRLEESLDLPLGSQAIITLTTFEKEEQEEITSRQIKLLSEGFDLGKKFYAERNDLYAR